MQGKVFGSVLPFFGFASALAIISADSFQVLKRYKVAV